MGYRRSIVLGFRLAIRENQIERKIENGQGTGAIRGSYG